TASHDAVVTVALCLLACSATSFLNHVPSFSDWALRCAAAVRKRWASSPLWLVSPATCSPILVSVMPAPDELAPRARAALSSRGCSLQEAPHWADRGRRRDSAPRTRSTHTR